MELLFEAVPALVEFLLEAIFSGPWTSGAELSDEQRQRRRGRRTRVLHVALVFVSVCFGVWWGRYVLDTGQTYPPLTLWSLLVIGGTAAIMAATWDGDKERPAVTSWWQRLVRFDKARWLRLAWLNLAGASGVALGYFV